MRRIFSLVLSLVFVIGVFVSAPVTVKANAAENVLTFVLNGLGESYILTECAKDASGEIVIPATYNNKPVYAISGYAFENCEKITSVVIPDSVCLIFDAAFRNCKSLEKINIPDSVVKIGSMAFEGTPIYNNQANWKDGALYIDNQLIEVKSVPASGELIIKPGTKTIADCAVSPISNLKSVVIPGSVELIGMYAFNYSVNLESVTIENGVKEIGICSFLNCMALKNIVIPESVNYISLQAFWGCSALETIEIPKNVTEVGAEAFGACESLKSVKISSAKTEIKERAFGYVYDYVNSVYVKANDFTIYAPEKSLAEKYATENGITFVSTESHHHEYSIEITKNATCTEKGQKKLTCFCGDVCYEDIPELEHKTNDLINAKEATCTTDGYTGDLGCGGCGKINSKGSVIKALGHNFASEFTKDYPTTPTLSYVTSRKCTRCGEKKCIQDIPPVSDKLSKYDMKKFDYALVEEREKAWISGDMEQGVYLGDVLDLWVNPNTAENTCDEFIGYITSNPLFDGLGIVRCMLWVDTNIGIIFEVPSLSEHNALVKEHEATHNSGDWVIERKATADQCGIKVRKCKDCGITLEMRAIQKVVTKLATPSVKVSSVSSGVKVNWSHVSDAEKYIIYRSSYNASTKTWSSWSVIKNNYLGTSYVDETVVSGTTYRYTVRAVNRNVKSNYKASASIKFQPTIKTTAEVKAEGIQLKWTADKTAESYVVYRRTYDKSTNKYSNWTSIKKLNKTTYLDTSVTLGTTYSYMVKAVNGNPKCKFVASKNLTYDVTPTVSIAMASNGIKVSWSTVANATGYTVYRSEYNPKTGGWSGWSNRGTAKADKKSWVDKTVKSGTRYRYTVRARYNSVASSYLVFVDDLMYLTQPTVKIANNASGVKVSWNKITGAVSYRVYRSEYKNGAWTSWKGMGTIKKNSTVSWVDKSVVSGKTYRYTVRAIGEYEASTYTASNTSLYLAQPKTTVKAVTNGINVSWTQCTGATGYTVYRSEYNAKTKQWSGWKAITNAKSTAKSYADKSAKKGVTYKYTVRAVNGDYKSTYAASGSVKR